MAKGVEKTVSFNDLLKKLDTTLEHLDKTLNSANKSMGSFSTTMGTLVKDANAYETSSKNIIKNNNEITKSFNNMEKGIKAISFNSVANAAKKIMGTIGNLTQPFVDYIEDLNLLKVAFGDTADEAYKLTKNIAAVTGYDQASLVRGLGTFRNLTSTLGMTNQQADLLAMNLEKMSLDISSLYNVDLDRAAYALQGVLTGQPRTIKTLTGANVTQQALQNELAAMGIDRKVRSLNQAEKAIVSYLSLERQLINSNGDMARTIEQPAQMLKVFRDQLERAARSIGSLFIPVLQAVLPYLSAILMVISEIIQVITSFFGIDADSFWKDMEKGVSAGSGGFDNLSKSIGGTSKAAKQAQLSLRGFDKLNVIKTPTSSGGSGGSGGGVSGGGLGISKDILKGLKEYNLSLEKIRTKATKIRDNIMKTLGFHKKLNEQTGKWEWQYGGILETIKGLYNWFKKLSPVAKIFVGYLTYLASSSLISGLKKLLNIFGNTGLYKFISNLLTPTKLLGEQLLLIAKGKSNLSIGGAVNEWSSLLTIGQKFTTVLVGAGGIVAGLGLIKDGIKKIAEEGNTTIGIIETGVGGLAGIIGGGLAGAAVGGAAGGLIGAIIGGIGSIIKVIDEVDTHLNTNLYDIEKVKKEVDTLHTSWKEGVNEVKEAYGRADVESDYYHRLFNELQGIVDENGKIKTGYEDRANVITTILSDALGIELKNVNGNIEGWKKLQGEIDNYILKRKNAIKLETLENEAKIALENLRKAQENVVKAYDEQQVAIGNLEPKLKKYSELLGISKESLYKYWVEGEYATEVAELFDGAHGNQVSTLERTRNGVRKQVKAIKEAGKTYDAASETLNGYTQTITNYETALGLSLQNNQIALDKFFDHEQHLYGKSYDEQSIYWDERKRLNQIGLEELEKNRDNYTKSDYKAMKEKYEADIELAKTEMDKLKLLIKTKNGDLSDKVVEQWAAMGKNSEKEFIANVSSLPDDVKKELYDRLKSKSIELTKGMQEALNANKPKVDIEIGAKQSKNLATSVGAVVASINSTLSKNLKTLNVSSTGKVEFKADGGFVDTGQIFIAREAGAEMVGRIGNKTAVANNDQIVSAISQGVTNAIMSTGGLGNRPIVIKADGDTNGLMNFIRFKQQEDDMQYGN